MFGYLKNKVPGSTVFTKEIPRMYGLVQMKLQVGHVVSTFFPLELVDHPDFGEFRMKGKSALGCCVIIKVIVVGVCLV